MAVLREMLVAMAADPDVFRAYCEMTAMLALPQEILARPGFAARVKEAAAGQVPAAPPGPSRAELLQMLSRW